MTHEQSQSSNMVERYVRSRLTADEKAAFEDHYFGCDDCFNEVQRFQAMTVGVRDAVASGALPPVAAARQQAPWWMPWALGAAAALGCVVSSGYFLLTVKPQLEREVASRTEDVARLKTELAQRQSQEQLMAMSAQPNLPLLMLQATRSEKVATVHLPPGVPQLALWLDVPPGTGTFDLRITGPSGTEILKLTELRRNSYGALSAAIPTATLKTGAYLARLLDTKTQRLTTEIPFEVSR